MSAPRAPGRRSAATGGDRALPLEEFERRIRAPLTEAELAETEALVVWFTRRYPTPGERLAYVRRAWRRWSRSVRIESP